MDQNEMLEYIISEARLHGVSGMEVIRVWHTAYNEHRNKHGSYRNLGEHYFKRMDERYTHCADVCLDYIIAHAEVKK